MEVVSQTASNTAITVNIAFDYGGRQDILQATKKILSAQINYEELSEDLLASYLWTSTMPDPDLVVRTGGDQRFSNFLIWQAANRPFFVTSTAWPAFGEQDLLAGLDYYKESLRDFG